ncbi:hypothetical protein [Nonomuraea sp. NPDC050202]|uniref:hypothetical protein n=1 Tax=Nonomuraea sp. NPDC050202 TaxID=3155035 RepID=UPI0033F2D17F
MAAGNRRGRLQRQPVTGFGHLQPPQQQESAVVVADPPAEVPREQVPRQEDQHASTAVSANPRPDTAQETPPAEPAEDVDAVPVQAVPEATAEEHEVKRQVPSPSPSFSPRPAPDTGKTSPQVEKPVMSAEDVSKAPSGERTVREEPLDGSITGTVTATRKRRSSPVGATSGYFQPRPAELPAPIKERLASLPPNYLRLYESYSDAANPAVGSAGRNVRLNGSLASRLARQSVADKRRLTAGTRRPALSPSHYIDAALRQARQQPLDVLVQMGQSFRIRTSHEELPKPNTYTLTSDVGVWIDDLKDQLTLVVAYKGMLGHILNACVEAFLDGLEQEASGSA